MSDELIELPEGWMWTTLGNLGEWSSGGTPSRKRSEYYGEGIFWIKTGDLPDGLILRIDEKITSEGLKNSSAKIFPSNSLVIAMYGATIGKLGIIKEPAATNQACAALLSKGLTAETIPYIFYYLLSCRVDLQRIGQGGAQPNISQAILKDYPCSLPPLNEQCRIVAKIEALRARSQRAKEALEAIPPLLEQFRQSVLAAAFRGDLTADWRQQNPDVEPASVLLERIRSSHHQDKTRNKEQEEIDPEILPELPRGWRWARLGGVSAIQGGIQKQPKRVPDKNAYPFLRVANVPRGGLNLSDVHRIELFSNELEKLRLNKGDLLIVEGNGSPSEIGRMAIWDGSIEDCVHQNHLIRVRLDRRLIPEFVEAYWNSPQGRRRVFDVAHTTTGLYTLSVSKIAKLPVPIAPEAEQVALMQVLEKLFKFSTYVQATIMQSEEEADQLNQSILAKAFRGELVPQDPNDEPASVLLERIRAERAKKAEAKAAKTKGKTAGRGRRRAESGAGQFEQINLPGLE